MARPTDDPKTFRMELRLSPDMVERLDEWRRHQPDIPTRSEAVRRLVERGFAQGAMLRVVSRAFATMEDLATTGRLSPEELQQIRGERHAIEAMLADLSMQIATRSLMDDDEAKQDVGADIDQVATAYWSQFRKRGLTPTYAQAREAALRDYLRHSQSMSHSDTIRMLISHAETVALEPPYTGVD